MSHYKPYPEYKDSGVEWIGEVPAHWGDTKFVRVFKEKGKDLTAQFPAGAISFGEVVTKDMRNEETLASYQALEEGEFIVNPLNLNYDLKSLRVALSDKDVRVSPGYIILRLRDGFQPRYVRWLMYLFDTRYMKTLGGGIRQTITFADIAKCHAAIPGSTEQSQIATFLDRETTRIDTLIEKKQRFIELLEEKRQAAITQAVTKGLDPNVPMKDSGVEWIGEVPAHWGAEKVGNLFAELNDRGGSKDELLAVSQEHGVLPQAEYAATVDRRLSQSQSGDYSNYKSVKPRSFVYNKMRMWQGAIGLSQYSGCVSPAYVTFRALHPVDESFYFGVFRTEGFVSEVNRLSQGICDDQNSCSFGDFRTIFVPSPPHREQSQIATFLDRETTRIDTLIEKTRESIERLKERRSALITAAVTGKIDVREEAAA